MKLLIDIADSEIAGFMEVIKDYSKVKVKPISGNDALLFDEIKEIKKAFKNVEKIKAGKLKGRPIQELLSEL